MTTNGQRWQGCIWAGKFRVNFGITALDVFSVVWNVVTNSSFAVGSSNTKENFQRVGWSLEMPDD